MCHFRAFFTALLSYFFVKKTRMYVKDGSMDELVSESVSQWEMYVSHTNQIGSTINSKQPIKFLVVKVNGMWEDLIPIQFIYSCIKEGENSHILGLLRHFLWVRPRILVMDDMSLEVWNSAWACCMQMKRDIFIFSYKGNLILLYFTSSKFN